MMKIKKIAILAAILAILLTVCISAAEFELSLLHEGAIPQRQEISADLYKEGAKIADALFAREEKIILQTAACESEVSALYELVVNSEPELMYVAGVVEVLSNGEGTVTVLPQYKLELLAYDSSAEFQAEVSHILSLLNDSMTDLEKALAVHDYFVRFYEYDYSYARATIADIFTDKSGVCQAYADAYTYIMNKKLGMECYTLTSYDINHCWNVIKIDGEWYHVDVTWDDPGPGYLGGVLHSYFMISSDVIRDSSHAHNTYDWCISDYTAYYYDFDMPYEVEEINDKRFDSYVWSQTYISPFIYYGGKWYFNYYGSLYQYNPNTDEYTLAKNVMKGGLLDAFDIYNDTVIYRNEYSSGVYLIPLYGHGYRMIEAASVNTTSFRVAGDKLECVIYINDDTYFYDIDLGDLGYYTDTPSYKVEAEEERIKVSFSDVTDGSDKMTYYYTVDGSAPTADSAAGPYFYLQSAFTCKVKAMAVKYGYNSSKTVTFLIREGIAAVHGDANGDGALNIIDAANILQYMAGWDVTVDAFTADVDGDGAVNIRDAARILQYMAGWDVSFE